MDKDKQEKLNQKKNNEKFNSITQKLKPENQKKQDRYEQSEKTAFLIDKVKLLLKKSIELGRCRYCGKSSSISAS